MCLPWSLPLHTARIAFLLLCLMTGQPIGAHAAAQARSVTLSVSIARSWVGAVYRGPLFVPSPLAVSPYRRGAVGLDGFTVLSGRVEIRPAAWPIGIYAHAGFGTARFHANGSDTFGRVHYETDTDALWLGAGLGRSVRLKRGLPVLELGAGVTAFRFRLPPPSTSPFIVLGPPVRDYLSPGLEWTLGLRYPAHPTRVQVEVRTTLNVLYHDTEGMDGNLFPGGLTGPDHRWAPTATLGGGVRLRL
jgi:hypothetical protein